MTAISTFIKYVAEWKSENSDGEETLNKVYFWLPIGRDPHEDMWPFLNLAELDAADFGYAVDVTPIISVTMQELEVKYLV